MCLYVFLQSAQASDVEFPLRERGVHDRSPFCKTGLCLGGGLVWRPSSVLVGRDNDGFCR